MRKLFRKSPGYSERRRDENSCVSTLAPHGVTKTQLAKYEYTPLEDATSQIRLLRFLDNAEHFEIVTVDLATAPQYRALSYTWDQGSTDRYEVAVGNRGLQIGQNLFTFLKIWFSQWERPPTGNYLWIDQICINQQAPSEKAPQVQMMGQIYKQAEEVLIWLGPDYCLTELEEDVEQLKKWRQEWPEDWSDNKNYKEDSIRQLKTTKAWHARYFGRLWIIQEILLAREIRMFCSCRVIPWSLFLEYCTAHDDLYSWGRYATGDHSSGVSAIVAYQREKDRVLSPGEHDILMNNRCSNLRDKYYGLQGLFAPQHRIKVDYTREVFEIFLDAAVMVLKGIDYQQNIERPYYHRRGLFALNGSIVNIASEFDCLDDEWWKRKEENVIAVLNKATERYLISCYTDDTDGRLTGQSVLTTDSKKHEHALAQLRADLDLIFRGPMELPDDSDYESEDGDSDGDD